jgi:hypothetical protein
MDILKGVAVPLTVKQIEGYSWNVVSQLKCLSLEGYGEGSVQIGEWNCLRAEEFP